VDKKASEKKERLLTALEHGMVMIHLDARRAGVIVPSSIREEAHLRLNLSYRFDPPDLTVGEWGIRSTLSFAGTRFRVAVPWSAIFAMTGYATKEFWMYPDDMPRELIQQTTFPKPRRARADSRQEPSKTVLREAVHETGEETNSDPPDEPSGRPRSHLRIIK
jgi:stringent starvation protein B